MIHNNEFCNPQKIDITIMEEDMTWWDNGDPGFHIKPESVQMILEQLDDRQINLAAITIQKYFRAWLAKKKYRWDPHNCLGALLELRQFEKLEL